MEYSPDDRFLQALDYIIHHADSKQLDVFSAALVRRKHDITDHGFASIDPEHIAHEMSESIQSSIKTSMENVRNRFREYAAELLNQEAPELSKEQAAQLLNSWIPPEHPKQSAVKRKTYTKLPEDVLYTMVIQFVSYSLGEMPQEQHTALAETMDQWYERYWQLFPDEIKQAIKSFLKGRISVKEFKKILHHSLECC